MIDLFLLKSPPVLHFLSNAFRASQQAKKVISISYRTVCFSGNVYLLNNIESFRTEFLNLRSPIFSFFTLIIFFAIITHFAILISSINVFLGFGFYLLSTCPFIVLTNYRSRRSYGLVLTTGSGERTLFPTTDRAGLREAVHAIRDLIDKQSYSKLEITIEMNRVIIISSEPELSRPEVQQIVSGDVNIFMRAEETLFQKNDK